MKPKVILFYLMMVLSDWLIKRWSVVNIRLCCHVII